MYGDVQIGSKVEFRGVDQPILRGDNPSGILFVFNKYTVKEIKHCLWVDFISLEEVDGVFDSTFFELIDGVSDE